MTPAENVEQLLETPIDLYPRGNDRPGWATAIGGHVVALATQPDGTFVLTYRGASQPLARPPAHWQFLEKYPAPTQTLEQRSQDLAHALLGLPLPGPDAIAPAGDVDLTRPLPREVFLRVVHDPSFRARRALHLRGRTGHRESFDACLQAFSTLPFQCEALSFDEVTASPSAWMQWAGSAGLRQVKRLGLKFDTLKDFNDEAFATLVNSVEGLEVLSLFWLDLTVAKIKALVASPVAQTIETLCFGNAVITPQIVELLLAAEFPRLRQLHLRDLEVTGAAEQLLQEHPNRPALRALEIKRYDATVWVAEPNPSPLFVPKAVHRYLKTVPADWSVHQSGDFDAYPDNTVVEIVPAHSVVHHSLGRLTVGTSGCQWPRCCSPSP